MVKQNGATNETFSETERKKDKRSAKQNETSETFSETERDKP